MVYMYFCMHFSQGCSCPEIIHSIKNHVLISLLSWLAHHQFSAWVVHRLLINILLKSLGHGIFNKNISSSRLLATHSSFLNLFLVRTVGVVIRHLLLTIEISGKEKKKKGRLPCTPLPSQPKENPQDATSWSSGCATAWAKSSCQYLPLLWCFPLMQGACNTCRVSGTQHTPCAVWLLCSCQLKSFSHRHCLTQRQAVTNVMQCNVTNVLIKYCNILHTAMEKMVARFNGVTIFARLAWWNSHVAF